MELVSSARKHGVSDDDACTNAIAAITTPDQPAFTMLLGPDRTAQILEIGVLSADDNDYVIHAMTARPKYPKMMSPRRGEQP